MSIKATIDFFSKCFCTVFFCYTHTRVPVIYTCIIFSYYSRPSRGHFPTAASVNVRSLYFCMHITRTHIFLNIVFMSFSRRAADKIIIIIILK